MIKPHTIAALLLMTTAFVPQGAQAQWYQTPNASPPPLYPYEVQNRTAVNHGQPYAVEVAPGTYVIQRPNAPDARQQSHRHHVRQPVAPRRDTSRPRSKVDPVLVEELRRRGQSGTTAKAEPRGNVVNTQRVVREKPKVVETKRYVDLPPRVVTRYTDENGNAVGQTEAGGNVVADNAPPQKRKPIGANEKRVIEADAEITIIGQDRMTIQLYRKGGRGKPEARLN